MIAQNLKNYLEKLEPYGARLVAVSKTKPVETIREAYDAGQRIFGENKVQELQAKQPQLPPDIEWHMIGHLQSNKVKYIAPFVAMIHGVDSFKLLKTINKEGGKHDRRIPCLLQFHIATEEHKFGLTLPEAEDILSSPDFGVLNHVEIVGVMGMATNTEDNAMIRQEFRKLAEIFNALKSKYFSGQASFREVSMGMSGDFQFALEEGSTLVRIGSAIFGPRDY